MVRGRIAHPQRARGLVAGPCSWGPNPRHVPQRRGSSPPGVVRGRIIRPFGAHGQCR
eukprot:gene21903-biopygen22202